MGAQLKELLGDRAKAEDCKRFCEIMAVPRLL
jgi:hypothetical protein